MDQPLRPLTLLDLLARQWRRPAAVGTVTFSADDTALAVADEGGGLALIAGADPEPAGRRLRIAAETGRATIRPRHKPVAPPVVLAGLGERLPPVVPHRRSCFLVGGGDGRLLSATPRGQLVPLACRLDLPAAALAHHAPTGRSAAAAGGEIALLAGEDGARHHRLEHPLPIRALAFAPDGRTLAAAHAEGVSLWPLADGAPGVRRDLAFAGAGAGAGANEPAGLSWSADGAWLACPLPAAGFQLLRVADGLGGPVLSYPAPVRSLAWSGAADALVTGGAFRVVAWSMAHPPLGGHTGGALATGRPGLVLVETVAAHPRRDLVAAGYANGQLGVMRLGRPDELALRTETGEAVAALAWSGDGRRLAAGTRDGAALLIELPDHLFKAPSVGAEMKESMPCP
ncbi:MAG: hypothetical protein U1E17_07185 [Geminicoccaceae bacterium]